MKLIEIFKNIKILDKKNFIPNLEIKNLSQKANATKPDSLFFCFKGVNNDGHNFYDQAIKNGAVALVVERFLDTTLPQILVKNVRNIMPKACNNFFGNVQNKIKLIGVTGTNGKTTTTHIIYEILSTQNKAGLIGTNGVKYNSIFLPPTLTTPDTVELFYLLNAMQKEDIEYVVMEVSAHSLALNKLLGLKFEVGIFTNLTQDHLDYFKTMNKYFLSKLKFFNKKYIKTALVNIDDPYGKLLQKLTKVKTLTYGINNPSDGFAVNLQLNLTSSNYFVNVFDNVLEISSPLPCLFNVYNTLCALSCCKILGIDDADIIKAIKNLHQIDGRMNCYKLKNGAVAIIDYAHTPDGLKKVLENLKDLNAKIITVFGCGGNRDKTKRSQMGEIAESLSDKVILTSDNPRFEEPKNIIDDILKGFKQISPQVYLNRTQAIKQAIEISKSGDIILIAGKGAENYQEINGIKYNYNDKFVLKEFLK